MLIWGGSWISAKWTAQTPAEVTTFWRFVLSWFSFIPILLLKKESFLPASRAWPFIILAALAMTLYNVLFFAGLHEGQAGKSGLLVATTNPLITFLLVFAFLRKKPGLFQWIGLALGLGGGFIQLLGDGWAGNGIFSPINLVFLAAAAAYSLMTVFGQKAQETSGLFPFSFWLYALSTLMTLPFAWPYQPFAVWQWGMNFWLNVLFLGILTGTVATSIYFVAAGRLGADRASSFIFLVPVTAVLLAWPAFGEIPQPASIIGGSLSLLAVWMINRSDTKGSPPRPLKSGA